MLMVRILSKTTFRLALLICPLPAPDNEHLFWFKNDLCELDDGKIDPALLVDDSTEYQSLASGGFGLEQEESTMFPLQSEPIRVA